MLNQFNMKINRNQIQEEALDILIPLKRSSAAITMGGGKTLIGLKHANSNYNDFAKFLVVAPKKTIFKEWLDQAKTHGLEHLLEHFTFTTYLSLPKQKFDYDVVYLDECHNLLNSHLPWLKNYKNKILGLTGTPPKIKNSEKGKIIDEFCPIAYEYKTDDAVNDKILNDYSINIHYLHLTKNKTIQVNKYNKVWYTSEQAQYDYWSNRIQNSNSAKETQIMRVMRMKALMSFTSKEDLAKILLSKTNNKVILFANTQEQADKFNIPSFHSKNTQSDFNLELFKKGKILKLAAVLQLSEGVNIPSLKEGIILHSYGNERKTAQRVNNTCSL